MATIPDTQTERKMTTLGPGINKKFADIFDHKLQECDDEIQMVTNLKFINMLLIGMTEMLHRRFKTF